MAERKKWKKLILPIISATVILALFIVKDAKREEYKDLKDSIENATNNYILRQDNFDNRTLIRQVSVKLDKGVREYTDEGELLGEADGARELAKAVRRLAESFPGHHNFEEDLSLIDALGDKYKQTVTEVFEVAKRMKEGSASEEQFNRLVEKILESQNGFTAATKRIAQATMEAAERARKDAQAPTIDGQRRFMFCLV